MLPSNKPYIIGETAFHHEGDIDFLRGLISEGAKLGLDAMKFHLLFDLDDYMIANHDAIDLLRPWCLSSEALQEILPSVLEQGMDLVLLCNDVASLNWVNQCGLNVAAIELHATGINDYFLLAEAVKFEQTVILGTGGSTIDEVQYAVDYLKSHGKHDLFLMHGFQNYPTQFEDINLSKMKVLNRLFDLPVGYADHTDPEDLDNVSISTMGIAAGFNVLEKHFTHRYGDKRIDSQAAVSLEQLKVIRRLANKLWTAHGNNDLLMSDAEKKYGDTGPMKKAIVARHNLGQGQIISLEDVAFKRTNVSSSLRQQELWRVVGLRTNRAIAKDAIIDFSNVEYEFQKRDFSQFSNTQKE